MFSADAARVMAAYATWQNEAVLAWADGLDDAARRADRGVFWGSIHGTVNHLLWGDLMWMSRFTASTPPAVALADSATLFDSWTETTEARRGADAAIGDWAARLTDADLAGDLSWWSMAAEREVRAPLWRLAMHFFNHQTHHRGQLHALATAAGATPAPTDLFLTPEAYMRALGVDPG